MYEILIKSWAIARPLTYPIRHEVFVIEQKIPVQLEIDEFDPLAMHLILKEANKVIGTARIYPTKDGKDYCLKIGRLALLKDYRKQGLGRLMMEELIRYSSQKGKQRLILNAQVQAIAFYEKLGFEAIGPVFEEDGISHQKCIKI